MNVSSHLNTIAVAKMRMNLDVSVAVTYTLGWCHYLLSSSTETPELKCWRVNHISETFTQINKLLKHIKIIDGT